MDANQGQCAEMPAGGEGMPDREMNLHEKCNDIRKQIEILKPCVLELRGDSVFGSDSPIGSRMLPEMHANIMLAYRHLEDARMRIGKVLQHYGGGVSKYDKEPEPEEEKTSKV